MARSSTQTYASRKIAQEFAREMKVSPTTKSVQLVGSKDVRILLTEITKAGKTSSRAKVTFR